MTDLRKLQTDPVAFRSALMIDADGIPKRFADVIEPWQSLDFAALDPAWRRLAGQDVEPEKQRAWIERPRGHSKTNDLAVMVLWVLFASRRPLSGIVAAADRDQAKLIRDAIDRLVRLNPWLSKIIDVQAWVVRNTRTGSELQILSSDVASSYGLTPDFVVCDELTHWAKSDLWESLFSSAAKRPSSLLLVICNAGYCDGWAWKLREAVRTDPNWYFSRLEQPSASWITPDVLAEQSRLLPNVAYRRLWMNEWVSAGGDALSPEVIDAAFRENATPHTSAQVGFSYVAGLDLGVARDNSALCILGVRREHAGHGQVMLAAHQVWRPTKGKKVNLQDVEDALVDAHNRFRFRQINVDPWNAAHMMSRLQSLGLGRIANPSDRRVGLPVVEIPPTGTNLQKLASVTIEAFNDFRLSLYPCAELKRDLQRLRVEERSYGFRLVSPRDEHGHGDLGGSAFPLALLAASTLAAKPIPYVGPLCDENNEYYGTGGTPLQRAAQRIERENLYRQQENADTIDDNGEQPWIEFMQMLGRR